MKQVYEQPIQERLVDLIREYDGLRDRKGRDNKRAVEITHEVEVIGSTAAFFGGFEGMEQLHDAAEQIVGNDNSVGYWVNRMWDGIGGWLA
jgi:hypothetical protein